MQDFTIQSQKGLREYIACLGIFLSGLATWPLAHRGFYRLARLFGKLGHKNSLYIKRMAPDQKFAFYLADPYWNRLVYPGFRYEEEIAVVLKEFKDLPYVFLDLGANFGYWSVKASSEEYGRKNVLAVEATSGNFAVLQHNSNLNLKRFKVLHAALTQNGKGKVKIHSNKKSLSNANATVVVDRDIAGFSQHTLRIEVVNAVSIDQLVKKKTPPTKAPLIIKLDVEGMEVPALKGASETLQRDVLIIYEEHGLDTVNEASTYILEQKFEVFFHDGQRYHQIRNLEDVKRMKSYRNVGYNFFATLPDSPFAKRLKKLIS